jgi:cellulose biosynthesis protein BcsQ
MPISLCVAGLTGPVARRNHRPGGTMSAPVIAFFNNKGGLGKTSLVYHLAWMMAEKRLRVVAADLDPQANLTANFLSEDRLSDRTLHEVG